MDWGSCEEVLGYGDARVTARGIRDWCGILRGEGKLQKVSALICGVSCRYPGVRRKLVTGVVMSPLLQFTWLSDSFFRYVGESSPVCRG